MQFPSIDRAPTPRHPSADAATSAVSRATPATPANLPVRATPPVEVTPGVVNMVNTANKSNQGEGVYTSISDPGQRGSEAATAPKDWTIHRPVTEKVEDPPRKPVYQMLIDHLKTMWTAGAGAIQLEQVKNQVTPPAVTGIAAPGTLAKEVLTYSPSKIRKASTID